MTPPTTYISFLLRLWRDRDPDHSEQLGEWQGEIEHIQSGRRWRFHTIEELTQFLSDPALNID